MPADLPAHRSTDRRPARPVRIGLIAALAWSRKQGHHQPWEPYGPPTEDDWDQLLADAQRRVARRLLSPKQFEAIRRLRPSA